MRGPGALAHHADADDLTGERTETGNCAGCLVGASLWARRLAAVGSRSAQTRGLLGAIRALLRTFSREAGNTSSHPISTNQGGNSNCNGLLPFSGKTVACGTGFWRG